MAHPLDGLSVSDLTALLKSLRGGRIPFPPTTNDITRLGIADELAQSLKEAIALWRDEITASMVIEAYLEGKQSVPNLQTAVQLVWSGPDCVGTYPRDTKVVVDELFKSSNSEILIAGYSVTQGKQVLHELAKRMDLLPNLKVTMVLHVFHREHLTEEDTLNQFAQRFRNENWSGNRLPAIYYDPRSINRPKYQSGQASMHAKCVVVDRQTAFITSANFTEAAQDRNIEVGTVLRNPTIAGELSGIFESLIRSGLLVKLKI